MESVPREYLPLSRLNWRVVIGLFAGLTTCLFFYRQLDFVANGVSRPALLTFLEEGVGGLAGFTVFPFMYELAVRFPLLTRAWQRNLVIHLLGVCLISVVHTTLIAAFRKLLFPLFGFGDVSYGSLPVRYPMEFAHLFIFYWVGVSLVYLFHEVRFARARELREARLESTLAEAQLQNLRLQLEPHFLFNALNSVSAALYEDPRVADEMLGRLSELLRELLKGDRSQEIPLRRELALLDLYVRVMQARFEDRLAINIECDTRLENALVPQLILQPIVENAFRHGADPATFRVKVNLRIALDGTQVRIAIRDHGPGFWQLPLPGGSGIGLTNTIERLTRLYGPAGELRLANVMDGPGALVQLCFPLRRAAIPTIHTEAATRA